MPQQEGDANLFMFEKYEGENLVNDGYGCYSLAGSSQDWIIPISDDVHMGQNLLGESSFCQWDQFPGKGLKLKCIEEWVIDLQHCSPVEEKNEMPDSLNQVKRVSVLLVGLEAARVEAKINPGMEAAKRYVSSLNPTTSAQPANHGLAVIPFLGAFVSLKVLILLGNSILRITGGALPRRLHLLNLSKNKISTLEGLRELTWLRILDLSYNKIVRMGHGLASCSSSKEFYLAGNRISEVEGLHRLLKLTVLDLFLNKISTSKCLGQLAAHYNSLKAISLEGNTAQKNVGDEQLKKYLQCTSSYQFERGIVSDHKSSWRGGHGVAALKQSSVATIKQKGQAADLPKQSRGKHGSKTIHRLHHHLDYGSKRLGSGPAFSIHRSQSEGSPSAIAELHNGRTTRWNWRALRS
ncbi:hypothetical protein Nepgr_000483 [Nepenthes gracilis]|uniref:Uncharacterized protein n=1 Tax=Nepenthes gracilis TaxID=150966 RepID=A0AAD3P6H1_NEPGR|nr:hypothetical protein Nepgr_000483 [Nepenthes gracilis]